MPLRIGRRRRFFGVNEDETAGKGGRAKTRQEQIQMASHDRYGLLPQPDSIWASQSSVRTELDGDSDPVS